MLKFKAVPVTDLCCVNVVREMKDDLTEEEIEKKRRRIVDLLPDSAFGKLYLRKRQTVDPTVSVSNTSQPSSSKAVTPLEELLDSIYRNNKINVAFDVPGSCAKGYEIINITKEEAISLALNTVTQDNKRWTEERKRRITGSVCYELYTYTANKSPDWDRKLSFMYNTAFKGNQATDYGKINESAAISAYEKDQQCEVLKIGLIVHPGIPWLGYSPDGFVMNPDLALIEVKCPIAGQGLPLQVVLNNLPYLSYDEKVGIYTLKRKHKYYGQVQLGMFLTGAIFCNFVIYCKFNDNCKIIKVPYDENFALEMVNKLAPVYFGFMLPLLMQKGFKWN